MLLVKIKSCHYNRCTICLAQVEGESNILLDGSLIDLCGAVLLWRSAEALKEMAVRLLIMLICRVEPHGCTFKVHVH